MTDPQPDIYGPLFTEKEELLAKAMVGVDEGWRDAALTNPQFQNQLFYMVRVVARLFDESSSHLHKDIEELDLKVRPYNVLKREGIHTIGELVERTHDDLLDMRNMGLGAVEDIRTQLATLGLKLKDD
jgi:DNA-directed RNA polymerase alpha subunit